MAGLAGLLAWLSACTLAPERDVLPYADHVRAAITPGDTITVETHSGEVIRMTVETVGPTTIDGSDRTVPLSDIVAIRKRSWQPLLNPCDDGTPVGCSVPPMLRIASDFHDRYTRQFEDACIAHDYCYRHGLVTYGERRADCDAVFLDAMQASCAGRFDLDPSERAECLLAATEFHLVVRNRGATRFLGTSGSYCEYRGPAK